MRSVLHFCNQVFGAQRVRLGSINLLRFSQGGMLVLPAFVPMTTGLSTQPMTSRLPERLHAETRKKLR